MSKFESLCRSVRAILSTDWDPIGIRDVPQAKDEYEQYVTPIATKLIAAIPASELSNLLLEIEIDSLGLNGNRDRARVVAEKLCGVDISKL